MPRYHPDLNPAAHSTAWLTARAEQLQRLQAGGTKDQRNSPALTAELRLLTTALATRTMSDYPRKTATKAPGIETSGRSAKRIMRDLAPPSDAELRDVARVPYQSYAPPVAPRPFGSGPYSACVVSANTDYSPKPNTEYR
jgi:hypothetical protein